MSETKKRKWGDRRDGRWVKAPGLQTVMAYLMPKRTDCEVYLNDKLDATELLQYLEQKNAQHPEFKTTVFHCMIMGMARMVKERPKMNRFIQGYRMYERDDISISFVVKRRFADGGEESLMVLVPKDDDTLDTVSRKIVGDVKETRKSETSTGGIDALLDGFAKLPRPILMLAIRIIRYLDFWGVNPKVLTQGDPNYTTILCSNLGSIKAPAVYHHLNNYGTNSVMVTIGTLHKEELVMPDGTKAIRDVIDFGATLDERIADGFYFARSLRLLKHIFAHPELLDQPLGQPSGFQYE
ncbi:MAG: 2-oxo acid dehydrogenase subunit E2 [Oscillospiraceae bacterium]|nr:2-oxo acid dehydrogenase subunit E2 [Oscillospiraceae bacterium]MBR0211531.1 2-oxo acid dehydrogenase subunit E2 [Oscillospiraceae bacterium]